MGPNIYISDMRHAVDDMKTSDKCTAAGRIDTRVTSSFIKHKNPLCAGSRLLSYLDGQLCITLSRYLCGLLYAARGREIESE